MRNMFVMRKKNQLAGVVRPAALVAAVCTLLVLRPGPAFGEQYTFGVVPQQSPTRLALLWSPVLQYISNSAGCELVFKTAPDIPTFEARCSEGLYDFAYMNPYQYVVFHDTMGYEAFARQKDSTIQGIIVVGKDSWIKDVRELDGYVVAFPAPVAFAASMLPRAALSRMGINVIPKYVNSHDSVYYSVDQGLYPAGGGIVRTFNMLPPRVRDRLRILWRTQEYSPHALAVHPRVPLSVVSEVRRAMTRMSVDPIGASILDAIGMKGLEGARDGQWDDIRALGLMLINDLRGE